jgi:hypothetical protein
MKVICITEKNFHTGGISESNIKVGDIHEVIKETYGIDISGARIPCYKFAAYAGTTFVHDKRNFAPLDSDLDETELVNEEFEEKYCVPVNS